MSNSFAVFSDTSTESTPRVEAPGLCHIARTPVSATLADVLREMERVEQVVLEEQRAGTGQWSKTIPSLHKFIIVVRIASVIGSAVTSVYDIISSTITSVARIAHV